MRSRTALLADAEIIRAHMRLRLLGPHLPRHGSFHAPSIAETSKNLPYPIFFRVSKGLRQSLEEQQMAINRLSLVIQQVNCLRKIFHRVGHFVEEIGTHPRGMPHQS